MSPTRRAADQVRPIRIERGFTRGSPGSVLYTAGGTKVLCTATVEDGVPRFLRGSGQGWITAEYGMLPGSTAVRKPRERGGKIDGRGMEIQRLIGRSLRAVARREHLGDRTVWLDCDVIEADGGTRTAAISGALVALVDALRWLATTADLTGPVLTDSVGAISVGVVDGEIQLDLDYEQDARAEVDLNVVLSGRGRFIEVQGTAEGDPFTRRTLDRLLRSAKHGIQQVTRRQQSALGKDWPF